MTDRQKVDDYVAKLNMAQSLTEIAKSRLNCFNKEEVDQQIKSLLIPDEFKDISAAELRNIIVQKYIEKTSIEMSTFPEKRKIAIDVVDSDILEILREHWEKKGFKVTKQENGPTHIEW